jgi:hypothetical protein
VLPVGVIMDIRLETLQKFFTTAATKTYAASGVYAEPVHPGLTEMEYQENGWRYRDSFMGYFKSYGREIIWEEETPAWVQNYGGGMEAQYCTDKDFAHETFAFLKQALLAGKKQVEFAPRGPKEFVSGVWKYVTGFRGNLSKFNGSEEIFYNNKLVFTHCYFGGVVVGK